MEKLKGPVRIVAMEVAVVAVFIVGIGGIVLMRVRLSLDVSTIIRYRSFECRKVRHCQIIDGETDKILTIMCNSYDAGS